MKRNTFLLASLGVAVVGGLLAGFGYLQVTRTVNVVVAKTSIPMNSQVTANELTTIPVPASFANEIGAVTNPALLEGKYLLATAVQGYPIVRNMVDVNVTNAQDLVNQYAQEHNTSGVLMQLTVSTTIEGLVQSGQDVALMIPGQPVNNQPVAPHLVGPVHVLSVVSPPSSSGSSSGSSTILLFVDDSQYQAVSGAISQGQAQVLLYPSGGQLPPGSTDSGIPGTLTAAPGTVQSAQPSVQSQAPTSEPAPTVTTPVTPKVKTTPVPQVNTTVKKSSGKSADK